MSHTCDSRSQSVGLLVRHNFRQKDIITSLPYLVDLDPDGADWEPTPDAVKDEDECEPLNGTLVETDSETDSEADVGELFNHCGPKARTSADFY